MHLFGPDASTRRAQGALFAVALMLSVLATVFFEVQVVSGRAYAEQAEDNRGYGKRVREATRNPI